MRRSSWNLRADCRSESPQQMSGSFCGPDDFERSSWTRAMSAPSAGVKKPVRPVDR